MPTIPRVAAFHDISGYGRCSLTVAIPILSAMGIQCCPIPTAVLSCHTGIPHYRFFDLTDFIPAYLEGWEENGMLFDAVYSGFLGSCRQIDLVKGFIEKTLTKNPNAVILVDPVLGDDGRLYDTVTEDMRREMIHLAASADCITPNITELCLMTDTPYRPKEMAADQVASLAAKLCTGRTKTVIVTGIEAGDEMHNLVYHPGEPYSVAASPHFSRPLPGAGDIFASVVCGKLLSGYTPLSAATAAASFVGKAAVLTEAENAPFAEGVLFEPFLREL